MENDIDDSVEYPVDGTLDLHMFHPREAKPLIHDYLTECRKRGILHVRIVHGKGTGTLREIVHSTLKKIDFVEEYRLAGGDVGSWGATIVTLITDVGASESKSGQ
jgi:DNA-nicking Smr family endonuclease